ncbi:MAG TPA: GGDEF domain-containing protein [Acidobacteriaceae bacterium]|jgi:diguanylate cyclase (GGDEF)-like protein|nr:GGDEF domain-containing protein [Acidobacteriaceae bacterium]
MSDSVRSNSFQAASAAAGQGAVGESKTRRPIVMKPIGLALATLAAVAVVLLHTAVAGANTERAAGFSYLCLALILFGCGAAFRVRASWAQGTLRIRWLLISTAALTASIGFEPSFAQAILHTAPARLMQTACFNASEALCMLAAVLFFAGVSRSIVIVDMLQALLFIVLRFNLIYSPTTGDHFATNHLIVGQVVAVLMFLVAMVACLGAASRAELHFLRTLSVFFGLRAIALFLSNQVSYTWLHYTNCSLWDVPGFALLAGFALYVLFTSRPAMSEAAEGAPLRSPSLLVRCLMPSFLALVNLMLALFLLRVSVRLTVIGISVALVCYVARTVLLNEQALRDHALLLSRNEQLEGLAVRDHLTGIGNRRSLAGVYARLDAVAGGKSVALLLVDVDSFKQANDCHGHQYGDQVLITLARMLESFTAGVAGSHCARLGGDEFAVLLPEVSPQAAVSLAEALRCRFGAHRFDGGGVSLSGGIAWLETLRDLPLETLVSCADEALYRSKLLGRNRVEMQAARETGALPVGRGLAALRLEAQQSAS